MQTALTVSIFALTLILIVTRPRRLNEAWFTVSGGAAMLLLGLVTPGQAAAIVFEGRDALFFLAGLLVLADLMRAAGFFEWAAIHAARSAKGSGPALFRNVFVLGAAVTALLSLDTTAVMLTPVVLAFVGRLNLKPRPFLFACAFIANTGSLLLQVSNLTNLLFAGAFKWGFTTFTARMALPQLLALGVNYLVFRRLFQRSLSAEFSEQALPEPKTVIPDRRFFRAAVAVFIAVVIGYGIGDIFRIPPYVFAISGAILLFGVGLRLRRVNLGLFREVSWSVFPFVIGLFVVVRAMENLGLVDLVNRLMDGSHSKLLTVGIGVFGAGFGSNVVNNIPMALLSISGLHHGADLARYASLIGCNIGPNLTVTGSLATMLVIASARKHGEQVSAADFLKVGLVTTPWVLAAAAVGLLSTVWLFR
jgi:arsenical pump membrane protein